MTGARVRGVQWEEGKACFSVILREHNIPFKLDSTHTELCYSQLLVFRSEHHHLESNQLKPSRKTGQGTTHSSLLVS